jgi:hypothetical protein
MRSLTIERFRGFERFVLKGLGRVNLIVGTNNSGKTTILEAANILLEGPTAIDPILARRGEDLWAERDPRGWHRQVEVRCLFRGHDIRAGSSFRIKAGIESGEIGIEAVVEEMQPNQLSLPFGREPLPDAGAEAYLGPYTFKLDFMRDSKPVMQLPMTQIGTVPTRLFSPARGPFQRPGFERATFVTASSLTADAVISLFDAIVLTPEEGLVLEALRIIEPAIERIASAGPERLRRSNLRDSTRGGMVVRLQNVKDRVPIGSMGDGIWRMLGLALALVDARDGLLLVDEIDTGLHYTVMEDMWRLVYQSAKRLNVQVLATTHSRDCTESLAAICNDEAGEEGDVTIQRVERGQDEAVAYSEREIVAAARYGGEVR